jgi:hypothetical protein
MNCSELVDFGFLPRFAYDIAQRDEKALLEWVNGIGVEVSFSGEQFN